MQYLLNCRRGQNVVTRGCFRDRQACLSPGRAPRCGQSVTSRASEHSSLCVATTTTASGGECWLFLRHIHQDKDKCALPNVCEGLMEAKETCVGSQHDKRGVPGAHTGHRKPGNFSI